MTNPILNASSAICDGCQKAAMYTVSIGEMSVCEECIDKAKEDVVFKAWMSEVNQDTVSACKLPERAWRGWYDDGLSTTSAAKIALQYEPYG